MEHLSDTKPSPDKVRIPLDLLEISASRHGMLYVYGWLWNQIGSGASINFNPVAQETVEQAAAWAQMTAAEVAADMETLVQQRLVQEIYKWFELPIPTELL